MLLVLSASVCVAAETRIALVIGNGTYREAPLKNPPEDARLIADTLRRLGFTVIGAKPLIDADQKTMKRAIRDFGNQLERAGSGGVGLFFYAGHAVQVNGKNYLIPVGADIRGEADLEDDTVSADSVLRQMTYAGARVNLVLDACRNNPYRGRFRSPTRGLAEMSAPHGSLVAYSTAPGDIAEDGTGKNSPYSAALAEAIGIADMPVELAFKRVGRTVMQTTGNRQVPWYSSSLIGDFYFAQPALVPPSTEQPAEKPPASPVVGTYAATPRVGETFRDCDECPEMVVVPAGKFTMGSTTGEKDEGPQHSVMIPRSFAVGKYEITRDEYARFAEATGRGEGHGCANMEKGQSWRNPGFSQTDRDPVMCVSWYDAKAYIGWLTKKTKKGYRLLTEAEWEYAARAGTTTTYFWGDNLNQGCSYANMADLTLKELMGDQFEFHRLAFANCRDGYVYTAPVGTFQPNGFGLYDMQGNVDEWVEDCQHDNYAGAPSDGSAWTGGRACSMRVLRGCTLRSLPEYCRSTDRNAGQAKSGFEYVGFRVARTLY